MATVTYPFKKIVVNPVQNTHTWADLRGCNGVCVVVLAGVGLQDKREVVQGVYSIIDQLSRTHLSTLERLIFHLVRWDESLDAFTQCLQQQQKACSHFTMVKFMLVCFRISFQEETNRMSANALAIVFAPCILRCPDTTDPLQSVRDISKTTA